jgi:hypothetical protein
MAVMKEAPDWGFPAGVAPTGFGQISLGPYLYPIAEAMSFCRIVTHP